MSDESAAVATIPAMPTPKKKAKGTGVKKGKVTPSHPKVSEMVNAAITSLKERGGSSLQAIKKYIGGQYKVDMDRLTPFLKKYLKSAVASGILVQTKGKGATGSFKLSATGQKANELSKKIKKSIKNEKKPTVVKKSKANVQKKSVKPKIKSVGDKLKKKTTKKASSPAKKTVSKAKSTKKIAKPIKPKAKKLKATTPKKATKKTAKK